jgi:uncharacterized protein involved in exopolysaccharide biosynthesis
MLFYGAILFTYFIRAPSPYNRPQERSQGVDQVFRTREHIDPEHVPEHAPDHAEPFPAGSFDAYQYLRHLRGHSRFILIVCAAAGLLALIVSLLLSKQYTATATIVIDPPAGNDPRATTAVNPVYFESLRAYELFAASDTLFQRAVEKFHLRDPQAQGSIEGLKRRILKVTKVRDTKILEIAATLPDPHQAQSVAQFVADETVHMTRTANLENDQDLLADARRRADEAQQRLDQAQTAWRDFSARQPSESLRADVEALSVSRERLERDLLDSRAELAEASVSASDPRLASVRARVASLEKQQADLVRELQAKAALLSGREARAQELEQRTQSARRLYDSAAAHVGDLEASAGSRGDRLRVLDPGVVPERPTSPNIGLNVALALALALLASVTYLTLTFRPAA